VVAAMAGAVREGPIRLRVIEVVAVAVMDRDVE